MFYSCLSRQEIREPRWLLSQSSRQWYGFSACRVPSSADYTEGQFQFCKPEKLRLVTPIRS